MRSLCFLLCLISVSLSAQNIPELKPVLGVKVDMIPEEAVLVEAQIKQCEELWAMDNDKLTPEQRKMAEDCDSIEGYWDIVSGGCNWYCGGGQDTNTATSALKSNGVYSYAAENIHDLSYKTAWVEGVPGYGIGEKITYHFPPENPRITKVKVVNGYVRSDKTWRENSRVKKLKMYVDGRAIAILNLADTKQTQEFSFKPIGRSDRKDWEKLQAKPWWTMTFEILEVYEGDRYDDTALTEIYFDGIDVH